MMICYYCKRPILTEEAGAIRKRKLVCHCCKRIIDGDVNLDKEVANVR